GKGLDRAIDQVDLRPDAGSLSDELNDLLRVSQHGASVAGREIEGEPHVEEEHHLTPLRTCRLAEEEPTGIREAIERGVHISKVQAHASRKQRLAYFLCLGKRRLEQRSGAVRFAVRPDRKERLQLKKRRVA